MLGGLTRYRQFAVGHCLGEGRRRGHLEDRPEDPVRREFREALEDGLDSQAMATEVRNNRALMFGKMLAGIMKYQLGDLEDSEAVLKEAAELAQSMSSSSFLGQTFRTLALVKKRQQKREEARKYAGKALTAIRDVGMTFIGPTVLGTCAAVCDDDDERAELLREAEEILNTGCVAHNYLWFAEIAIDDAASRQEWQSVLRHADRLERYTQSQPLEWSNFMIRRARALAKANQGDKSEATMSELRMLKEQAELSGLTTALPALELAIAS